MLLGYDPWLLAVVVVAGVAAGFLNTMAGGGSLLTLPALMVLGLPAEVANGSNRLSVVTQSLSGVVLFHREGKLHTGAIGAVLAPTVAGSLLGAVAATRVPGELLKPVLLVTLIAMATLIALRPAAVMREEGEQLSLRERPSGALGLFAAGLYGGFVQAGVGFVLLTVLAGALRYDLVRANALKLVCTLVFGLVALAVFVVADQVEWAAAAVLAASTVVGSQLGVRFAVKVDPKVIRWIVFVCVVATSIAAFARE